MADTFEVIYKNRHSGVEGRCSQSEWERIKAHKTLGRAFIRVRIEKLPTAAIEAMEAKEQAAASTPKTKVTPATKTRSRNKDKSTVEEE